MDASEAANTLPNGWTWERFKVIDAGEGDIALHSVHHNRFIMMNDQQGFQASLLFDEFSLPIGHLWERFKLVDALNGKIALHSAHFNRFMMMGQNRQILAGGILNWDALPAHNHDWERFTAIESSYVAPCPLLYFAKMASCKAWLVGQTVAFYSTWHSRFIQMVNQDHAQLTTSAQQGIDDLCDGCAKERFRVVDIGNGWVGLYNEQYGRYVFMNNHQVVMAAQKMDMEDIPAHHSWERFRVVDLGNDKIGLHNPHHNRFIMLTPTVTMGSGVFNWDALPSVGHEWERLTIHYISGSPFTPQPVTIFQGEKCYGPGYTTDACGSGNCNGWEGLTQQQCIEKCILNELPEHCPDKGLRCAAAVWEGGSWCHLYTVCHREASSSSVTLVRREPQWLQLDSQVTRNASNATENTTIKPPNELAAALPLVLINVSNFSGLVSSKDSGHLDVTHDFGNFSEDVKMLSCPESNSHSESAEKHHVR